MNLCPPMPRLVKLKKLSSCKNYPDFYIPLNVNLRAKNMIKLGNLLDGNWTTFSCPQTKSSTVKILSNLEKLSAEKIPFFYVK